MTPLTAIATSVAHPRVRSPRWAVTFPTMRSTELTATSSSLLQQETEHQGAEGQELGHDGQALADEHRSLVDRREQQALERSVLALMLVRAAERKDRGEQHGEPQQSRRGLLQERPARPQGKSEGDEEGSGEGEHRRQRVSAADLDAQILLGDDQALAQERHGG